MSIVILGLLAIIYVASTYYVANKLESLDNKTDDLESFPVFVALCPIVNTIAVIVLFLKDKIKGNT